MQNKKNHKWKKKSFKSPSFFDHSLVYVLKLLRPITATRKRMLAAGKRHVLFLSEPVVYSF